MENTKNYKVCFIGHRRINSFKIIDKLKATILKEISLGCRFFTLGCKGEFDNLALSICREFRKTYPDIVIELVITSLNTIKKKISHNDIFGIDYYSPYEDIKTIMYEIEDTFYKRKIIESNKHMIDSCNVLICYVNPEKNNSGAKIALNYAKQKNLKIINIF